MTETVGIRNSTSLPPGHNHRHRRAVLPVRRFGLGVATGFLLAASLLAAATACGARGSGQGGPPQQNTVGPTQQKGIQIAEQITGGEQIDRMLITDHLYLNGPDGTTFEISVGKDANGQDVVTATRVFPK
jgi:hypothetical protein